MKRLVLFIFVAFTMLGCQELKNYEMVKTHYNIEDGQVTDEVYRKVISKYKDGQIIDSKEYMGEDYLHSHSIYTYLEDETILEHTSNGQVYVTTTLYEDDRIVKVTSEKNGIIEEELAYTYDGDEALIVNTLTDQLVSRETDIDKNTRKIENLQYHNEIYTIEKREDDLLKEILVYRDGVQTYHISYEYNKYNYVYLSTDFVPGTDEVMSIIKLEYIYNEYDLPTEATIYSDDVVVNYMTYTYEELE